jgi:hypothetical protein
VSTWARSDVNLQVVKLHLGRKINGAGTRFPVPLEYVFFLLKSHCTYDMNIVSSDGVVTEHLAGAIPTQIGLLAQLTDLQLYDNQLTSASNKTRLIEICCRGAAGDGRTQVLQYSSTRVLEYQGTYTRTYSSTYVRMYMYV